LLLPARADDGMWIPMLLDKTRYDRMLALGCKLTPEDIYSVNNSSLKDAVLLFDRGCSGVVVSDAGLVFTNHHCGYGAIQNHSTLEHDYLTDGFIANSRSEELPNPGVTVSFLVKMDDVTSHILKDVSDNMTELDRKFKIQENIEVLIAESSKNNKNRFIVKPLYNENQYFIYEYEVFTDIRLVAAPPSNIGKFGGDTDNWVWPRHTGDFAVFRIYADKNNRPATYSPDNVPYKPKKFVPVSIKGVAEDDFTMVYGFPAITDQYLTSREVDLMVNLQLPQKVELRRIRLNIMKEEMDADPLTRIKYSAKYAGVSNAWKKWEGMIKGLSAVDAVSKKKEMERQFAGWVAQDETRKATYQNLFNKFNANFDIYQRYALVVDYYGESVLATELISQASRLYTFMNKNFALDDAAFLAELKKHVQGMDVFYKNYDQRIDKRTLVKMVQSYRKNIAPEFYPDIFTTIDTRYKGDYSKWADYIFSKSLLASKDKLHAFMKNWNRNSKKKLSADPAISTFLSFYGILAGKVAEPYNQTIISNDSLYRIYMRGLQEFHNDRVLFPNANQSLRVSYGQVKGYSPTDAVKYGYYTTIDGIIEKQDSTISDYVVSPKLIELWKAKDYGQYADSTGVLRVCFAASNHTSGGNSGSPVFNATGELIGLNFDRCWEGTMSDIYYDPALCRNIVLDSRYMLFVIEKISGARHLIEELQIVR
jgi:hypothetical protein